MANKWFRVFTSILIALVLIAPYHQMSVYAQAAFDHAAVDEEVSLTTTLVDNFTTKADKLTFDLWAYDAAGDKINASNIQVTSNGKVVPINWDDTEKTSYTLNLEVGNNHVVIVVDYNGNEYSLEYNIIREYAEDGDVIGKYIFSLEAFTIGLGYLIEPIEVDIIKGRNAAYELDAVLKEHGFDYWYTGTLDSNFYLAGLEDGTNTIYKKEPNIPDVLKEALQGNYDETNYWQGELGEFDFNSWSGWMYSVNNVFPNVGFADFYLSEGDVMRVQYTIALGADIGGGWGNNFFEASNKDELTRRIAEINSSDLKEEYLSFESHRAAYEHAMEVLQTVNATQESIDQAYERIVPIRMFEQDLEAASRVDQLIAELPEAEKLQLSDQVTIESARSAYEDLTDFQKELVSNLEKLEQLEERLIELEKEEADRLAASEVERLIDELPSLEDLNLSDSNQVAFARSTYDALTEVQKALVSNIDKLEQLEERLAQLAQEASDQEAASQVVELIESLPSVDELALSDREQIESARSAYEDLTDTQKSLVSNIDKLEQLEERLIEMEKEEEERFAVSEVERLIEGLPSLEELELSDRKEVASVRSAYELLSEEQQELVANLSKLEALEEKLQELVEEDDQSSEEDEVDDEKETENGREEEIDNENAKNNGSKTKKTDKTGSTESRDGTSTETEKSWTDGVVLSRDEANGDESGKLPVTATNMFNIILFGAVLVIAGAVLFFTRKYKAL